MLDRFIRTQGKLGQSIGQLLTEHVLYIFILELVAECEGARCANIRIHDISNLVSHQNGDVDILKL